MYTYIPTYIHTHIHTYIHEHTCIHTYLHTYITLHLLFFSIAVEFFDEGSSQLVKRQLGLQNPLEACPFYVLIETSGSNEKHDQEVLKSL